MATPVQIPQASTPWAKALAQKSAAPRPLLLARLAAHLNDNDDNEVDIRSPSPFERLPSRQEMRPAEAGVVLSALQKPVRRQHSLLRPKAYDEAEGRRRYQAATSPNPGWFANVSSYFSAPTDLHQASAVRCEYVRLANQVESALSTATSRAAGNSLVQAQSGFKFPYDKALHRKLGIADQARIRETFSPHGFLYLSQKLDQGTFSKFRVAMDLGGSLYGVKELRIQAKQEGAGDAQTLLSSLDDVAKEIDATREFADSIRLFGSFKWNGKFFLLMTLFKGDATNVIDQVERPLRGEVACLAFRDVAAQLMDVHQRGAVHRDVKWENVFVSEEGRFVLGDFAICKRVGELGHYAAPIRLGSMLAPELCGAPHDADGNYHYNAAGDIFALGAGLGDIFFPLHQGRLNNPFCTVGTSNGGVGWASDGNAVANYTAWYDSLRVHPAPQAADSRLDLRKIRNRDTFGRYFSDLKRLSPDLTHFVLTHMLSPDPTERADAAFCHAFFAERVAATAGQEAQLYAKVKSFARFPKQSAAIAAMQRLHAYRQRHAG